MTGTGTETDPFIISAKSTPQQIWADFIQAIGTSGAYVQCPKDYALDMNKVAPEGWNTSTRWRAKQVYGNGFTICSLHSSCSTTWGLFRLDSSTHYVHELNFDSFYYTGTAAFFGGDGYNSTSYFKKCGFFGIMANGSLFDAGNKTDFGVGGENSKGCVFDIQFLGDSLFHKGTYSMTHFFSTIIMHGNSTALQSATNVTFKSCRFLGKLPFPKFVLKGQYNVFDIDIAAGQEIAAGSVNGADMQACIINSDKVADGAILPDLLKPVTSVQMSDASYLSGIDFPIGVEE